MGVTGSMGSAIQGIHSELSIRKGPCVLVSVRYDISSVRTCYCRYCTSTPASSYSTIYSLTIPLPPFSYELLIIRFPLQLLN